MKKLFLFLALFASFAVSLRAQNLTTVSASNIQDINGVKLAAGQLCFQATDQADQIISFQIGGGGQALRRQFCAQVTNGGVTPFTVPNPANTQPSGIYYRITVRDSTTGLEVLRYTQAAFAGGAFNFDNYAPTFPTFIAPVTNATVGNLTINGNLSVTGAMTFTPSALTASNATINQATNGNDAIFGKRATDTSPTGNFMRFRTFANSADLWTVDVTGTLQAGTIPTARLSGAISSAQLPNPTSSTLGGVQSFAAVSHQWINSISTLGVPTALQPSFADISGTATGAQLPNPSASTLGGVQSLTAPLHQWINSISTSGVPAASQPAAADLSNGTTGSGAVVLAASPALTTPNIGAATGNTVTFVTQTAPSNPSVGNIVLYGDSGTGNIACRNNSGGSCLTATATAPFTTNVANPAQSGILRVATGDTAVAFRNNANTADIVGLSKNTSDIVSVGGSAGITTLGPVTIGATDTGISRTAAAAVAVGNGTAGDSSGSLKALSITSNTHTFVTQTAPSNPSVGSIVLYGDSGTGNITCRNNSGGSCLTATASAPLITGSANPAQSGIVRVATGDTAVAFRNNANTADIAALTKNSSDIVSVGGSAGIAASAATLAGTGAGAGTSVAMSIGGNSPTTGGIQVFVGQVGTSGSEKFRVDPADGTVRFSILQLSSLTSGTFNAPDTGLSRTAAATVALGNGTQGDASGTLKVTALNNGGALSLPASADTLVGRATTDTLTNKTIDAEATGNAITLPFYVQIPAAGCNNATATANWDLPTTNAPTPTCLTGTNTQQASADFDDTAARTMQTWFVLPPGWTGNVDMDITWLVASGGGSNTVKFTVATACSASGATFDPAFNTANTITSGTVGANNAINVTSQTAITMTGCSAGNVLHVKFGRDNTDTSTATVKVLNVAFTIRRAM